MHYALIIPLLSLPQPLHTSLNRREETGIETEYCDVEDINDTADSCIDRDSASHIADTDRHTYQNTSEYQYNRA